MRLDLLSELNKERAARRAAVVVTDLASGTQRLVRESDIEHDPLANQLTRSARADAKISPPAMRSDSQTN